MLTESCLERSSVLFALVPNNLGVEFEEGGINSEEKGSQTCLYKNCTRVPEARFTRGFCIEHFHEEIKKAQKGPPKAVRVLLRCRPPNNEEQRDAKCVFLNPAEGSISLRDHEARREDVECVFDDVFGEEVQLCFFIFCFGAGAGGTLALLPCDADLLVRHF